MTLLTRAGANEAGGVAAVASLVLGVLAGVLWAALEGPVVM